MVHKQGGASFHVAGMRVRRETENISWCKSHLNGVLKGKVQTGTEGESVRQAEKQVEERQIHAEWLELKVSTGCGGHEVRG